MGLILSSIQITYEKKKALHLSDLEIEFIQIVICRLLLLVTYLTVQIYHEKEFLFHEVG